MPHKRAKRSVREQERNQKGTDLAPSKQSLSSEAIPKSLSRVLNATKVREQWKAKKRKLDNNEQTRAKKPKLISGIQPGESLQHYNKFVLFFFSLFLPMHVYRRVEDDMRPLVRESVKSSDAVVRNARKEALSAKAAKNGVPKTNIEPHVGNLSSPPLLKSSAHSLDFQSISSSAPRRLNDIALAPPEIKRHPRGLKGSTSGVGKRDGVLSLAQKTMMGRERENAIARYRELKAFRRKDANDQQDEEEES
ncbi:hypothetical protein GYMLUDRAFT_236458 [Collybiopsis luxurians FD-317 M1]|nr:hypothetical protein GYMLUDRAFT_236458 [Collybiopsis luxurians FD-317 M1]